MGLVLTFLACLAGEPNAGCERIQIPWNRSPLQCMVQGQMEMARWFAEHPAYRPRGGWRCERDRQT